MFGITLRNLKNIFSTYKSIPNKKLVRLVKNVKIHILKKFKNETFFKKLFLTLKFIFPNVISNKQQVMSKESIIIQPT